MYQNGHKNGQYTNGKTAVIDAHLPPYSQDAEEAVLGCMLIDPDAVYMVSDTLRPVDFYLARHQVIYQAVLDLVAKNTTVDPVTLGGELTRRDSETGWPAILAGLIAAVPTSSGVQDYARIVSDKATRRRMIQAAGKIATIAYDETGTIEEQLDTAETEIFMVRGERSREGVSKPRQYVGEYLNHFERLRDRKPGIVGLPSGFLDLDRMLEGFQAPHQYILAARPGMGKSAMALNIAVHLAIKNGKRVAFFSLEMSKNQLMNRMIAGMTGIDSQRVQKPWELRDDEANLVMEASGRISDSRLFIDPTEALSSAQVRAKCLRLYAEHGLDLVIVDHLHLMRPDRNLSRPDLEIGEISWSLANLAKTINAPVLTLAQLSRGVESRQNKRPQMSDLRESGRIEENAYCIMFLYRDDYYNDMSDRANIAEIVIPKHREGPTGTIDLYWNPRIVSFKNLERAPIL